MPPVPLQNGIGFVELIDVGAVDSVRTVTVTVNAEVFVLHGLWSILRTQYVVVTAGLTVIDAAVCPASIPNPVKPVPHS